MKFCTKCDNMYYITIDDKNNDQLIYYCRFCGHKDEQLTEEGVVVLKTQYKKNEQKFNHMVNQYTKLDPTLPRIYSMKCPNHECKTNHGSNHGSSSAAGGGSEAHRTNGNDCEVIYLRYDDDNMKYLYICTTCDTSWKTDDDK